MQAFIKKKIISSFIKNLILWLINNVFFFIFGIISVVIGISLIFFVIYKALKIKKIIEKNPNQNNLNNLSLQKLLPFNLSGLFLSFIGIISLILFFILS